MELAIRDGPGLLKFLKGVDDVRDVEIFTTVNLTANHMNEGQEVVSTGSTTAVPWTFSTFDIDRYSERIDPKGWVLDGFLANPIIQWAHLFDVPAIGRASDVFADDSGLHGSIVFNDREYDPFGWSIGERVKAGVLRAGSVGFRPIEVEIPGKADGADGTELIFRKQELLEFSVCNVPANPFALVEKVVGNVPLLTSSTTGGREPRERKFWGGFLGMQSKVVSTGSTTGEERLI
jgi:HK97 family phage prohead protease